MPSHAEDTAALLVVSPAPLAGLGALANHYASAGAFAEYQRSQSANTRRRHVADLALFGVFLHSAGVPVGDLSADVGAWSGVTWGLVKAFVGWQLQQGYAIGSVNARLATVRTYCKLGFQAGVIPQQEYALIALVKGFSHKAGRNVDKARPVVRVGAKKAQPVGIDADHASALKQQPDTPQGRRDALLLCLLLDHGMRVSEVAALTVDCFNLRAGLVTFYREKTDQTDTHALTTDARAALLAYMDAGDCPPAGALLRGSRKGGKLTAGGMTVQAICARVAELGQRVGLPGLSPHDCRHAGATNLAGAGKNTAFLQSWGGWKSPAMAARYVNKARIANEGCTDIWHA